MKITVKQLRTIIQECLDEASVQDIARRFKTVRRADPVQMMPRISEKTRAGLWALRDFAKLNGLKFVEGYPSPSSNEDYKAAVVQGDPSIHEMPVAWMTTEWEPKLFVYPADDIGARATEIEPNELASMKLSAPKVEQE